MKRINILILLFLVALSGCDTLARIGLEQVSDSRIRYGSHCETLRMQCRSENYREWQTVTGKLGCSCDGPSNQQRSPGDVHQSL